ncbi:MAG TPA: UbiA family prenyltransferase [Candidatus Solibacter sp.]|jgi:4-hydroxybenzoate polyprenyltransferase|nr:UbiA family prenyltransferase [Candidatus Solibacter sp.]
MRQTRLSSAAALAASCHPEPTLAVTTLATVLAVGAGRGAGAVWVAAAVFCGQLSVGWANDYIDRDRDRLAGRTSKPVAAGRVSPALVRNAAVVALVLAALLSLASGPLATAAHLLALLMAHLYNLGLKSTPFSVVAYAVAFAQLPAFITLGLHPPHLPPAWAVLAAGLIGAAGHFTQTLPDLESDRTTGMRGLPHRLGAGGSLVAVGVLLAGGALAAALGPIGHPPALALVALGVSLALVLAVLVAGALRRYSAAFHLTIAAAGAAVATFLVTGRPI